ncbi:MAG TPA: carboxylating nicotinate-nucleotide diphosphorylase [Candidatus Acidoferrum sp.]|nr:carboxylating nicotinate-nucleotide diphosphorylase [Candidatus Acidoferrum sp.]
MSISTQAAEKLNGGSREERIRAALYRGHLLTLRAPLYLDAVRAITSELLREDTKPADLTVEAMELGGRRCVAEIRAKEAGVAAGLEEAEWIYERAQQSASRIKNDGDTIGAGDLLLRVEGDARALFSLERLAVNLLQRMGGIATATRKLVEAARLASPAAHVVGTRKTPWGLLDKRAVHWGGGGTHRLSLSDAVLIKTNHLRLASRGGTTKLDGMLRGAWQRRGAAAFFEVEVTGAEEAVAVARVLNELQADERSGCPCLVLLDNFSPDDAAMTVRKLRNAYPQDAVIVEASGGVSEETIEAYAHSGVDVISSGALTHSVRALDLSATVVSADEVKQK